MKLVYKILLLVVLPTTILSLLFLFFINNMLSKEVEKRFLQSIENTTNDYAKLIQSQLNNISNSAYYTTKKIENNPDLPLSDIKRMLNETIDNDSLVFGASVFFDTTFPGNINQTMVYASRNGDNINTINFNSLVNNMLIILNRVLTGGNLLKKLQNQYGHLHIMIMV